MTAKLWGLAALVVGGCGGSTMNGLDAGAGPEAGVDARAPERDAGADAGPGDAGPPPEREPATDLGDEGQEIWAFMQSHLHTTGYHACANSPLDPGTGPEAACYSGAGIRGFLEDALANGASDMIITDHNNIDAWFDPAFAPLADLGMTRYATPLRGTEWSSRGGHMTLLFPSEVVSDNLAAVTNGWIWASGNDTDVVSVDDYAMAIRSVHAEGGVAIINHPELAIHAFPEDSLDADGVEVGIPPNPLDDVSGGSVSAHSSAEARLYWHRRLLAGQRLAATAGADHHHGGGDIPGLEAPTFGIAVNLLRIDPALPDTAGVAAAIGDPAATIDQRTAIVMDAIRRGHVMVVEDGESARVYVGADLDGDGRFHDARAGDCVLPDAFAGTEVRVRLRIVGSSSAFGSSHYNLDVWDHTSDSPARTIEVDYDDGFPADPAYTVDPSDPFAIEMTVPFDAAIRGFLRFVLERDILGPVNDTEVVTNPIYLGAWGAECDDAAPLY